MTIAVKIRLTMCKSEVFSLTSCGNAVDMK